MRLKALAKNSVGHSTELLIIQLKSCLSLINALDTELSSIESHLKKLVHKFDPYVFSIRGIGSISALSIIAEYANFVSFDSPAQMLSFSGMEPSINQSGTSNKQGHMVKRGSGYLRETLMNVALPFTMHNPCIYDYYSKKRNEGKSHRVALTHVVKKLVRIIFHLTKNNLLFDSSKLV